MDTRQRDTGRSSALIAATVERTARRTISTVLVVQVVEHGCAEHDAAETTAGRVLPRPLARAGRRLAAELAGLSEVAS